VGPSDDVCVALSQLSLAISLWVGKVIIGKGYSHCLGKPATSAQQLLSGFVAH